MSDERRTPRRAMATIVTAMATAMVLALGAALGACGERAPVVRTATGDSAAADTGAVAVLTRDSCTVRKPRARRHWDTTWAVLPADPSTGAPETVAMMLAYPGFEGLGTGQLRREVPVALVRLGATRGKLEAGVEYCMTSQFTGTEADAGDAARLNDPTRWTLRYYRLDDLRTAALETPLAARMPDAPDAPSVAPRPAARFTVVEGARIADAPPPAPPGDTAAPPGAAIAAAGTLGRIVAGPWYRCGNGCCSGRL